jgi:succinate-semialdehyde dehydrogenase/glutarate-semialdehyde dehydrogenase
MLQSINPYDESLIAEFEEHDESVIDQKLDVSQKTFRSWKRESFARRGELMKRAGSILRRDKSKLSKTMATEMGKVLKEAEGEIEKCASACDFFADNAEAFLKDQEIKTDAARSLVTYQPLGAILAIMPWNFPFWQVFRFAAPSLMAGNVGVLKHASNVGQCSLAIEIFFARLDFPKVYFSRC